MSMRMLRAAFVPDGQAGGAHYAFRVWLDTDRALPDGSPDPDWTLSCNWDGEPAVPGMNDAEYRDDLLFQTKQAARYALAARTAGPPTEIRLPSEGSSF